ncbi:MAG: peptidoglycan DD-metalloendopeptidase family protein [Candidatus Daviesbacteria bacterium]|nr:peptidoglycan DD-metalloendopeptidase family protein [Candidatus Daviesbacteria bacterium]
MNLKLQLKNLLSLFLTLLIILTPLLFPSSAFGQNLEEQDKRLRDIQEEIAKLERSLNDAQGQEKTLKTQLTFIDTQTQLTKLKVEETTAQIAKLEREIGDLSNRITRLSGTVDIMTNLLLNRIVQTYKYGNISSVDLFFSTNGFSDLLVRTKYVQVAQANDKKILYQLQATKATYNDQKVDKERRQTQHEKLKKDLQTYQSQLTVQRKSKQELLIATQNDEAKYQAIISRLKAEQESIARAISNIGTKVGPVSKGQQIAAMGSTGCSTGPHLHYEVFENAKVEDGRIVGNRASPKPFLSDGRLGPPTSGYPDDTIITTEYGEVYFLGTHTGLDIAPKKYEGVGRAILASADGIAYSTSAPCSIKISGGSSVGKGVIIDHQNGLVTLYWHVL